MRGGLVALGAFAMMVSSCVSLPFGRSGADETTKFDVPRDADGVETWDLREPPTAEYVGIQPGENTAVYSSLDPRPVRVLLPDDVVIDAELTTVTFDNFLAPDGSQDPHAMNLHSQAFAFDEAIGELRPYLTQLGLSEDAISEWKADIEAATDERPIRGGASTTVGYMQIGVGGRYTFEDDAASLSWGAGWGPLMEAPSELSPPSEPPQ